MKPATRVVHVVMAVHEPDPDQLSEQMASLARQIDLTVRLHAVLADLTSGALVRQLAETHGLDLMLHLPAGRLGAVAAFEFGLRGALAMSDPADLFALCDQDDIWDPDRLSAGADRLDARPASCLVHSDARLIDAAGAPLAPSLFAAERRDLRCQLRRLLYRNAITGMTVLMRREVVEYALPFPRQNGVFFYHDLWLGLVAAALGPIAFVRRPLVSYRQHAGNAVGLAGRVPGARFLSRSWLRHRFASFSVACFLAKSLMLRAEEVERSHPGRFDRARLAQLRPYLAHHGLGLPFFRDATLQALAGRAELADHSFSQGVIRAGRMVWAVRRTARLDLASRLQEFDHMGYAIAPGLIPQAAVRPAETAAALSDRCQPWQNVIDARRAPRWTARLVAEEPAAVVILLPTLNPTEIFAGIATAIELGIGLAERGLRVRFIATDLPMISASATENFILDRITAPDRARVMARIETVCGVTRDTLCFSPHDRLMATAWWTAHVAARLLAGHGFRHRKFLYLIQDFEPNFYAWGSDFAGAMESYALPCEPVFNTTLLRDYFCQHGFALAAPDSPAFRPSIDIGRYSRLIRPHGSRRRRIAVYGRPEVPRNMFPVCVEALAELIDSQAIARDMVELVSVGLAHDPVLLPGGHVLRSLGKLPLDDYPVFLTTVDLGLALMYSPHPSHVPIEMAAAGARVVTNGFGPKNLSRLSPLIRSTAADPGAVATGLIRAWHDLDAPAPRGARDIDLAPLGMSLEELTHLLQARFAGSGHAGRLVAAQ